MAHTGMPAVLDQRAQTLLEAAGETRDGVAVVQSGREQERRDELSAAHRRDDVEEVRAVLVRMLSASRWKVGEPQERALVVGLVELTEIVERDLRLRYLREPPQQIVVLGESDGHAERHAAQRYLSQLLLHGAQDRAGVGARGNLEPHRIDAGEPADRAGQVDIEARQRFASMALEVEQDTPIAGPIGKRLGAGGDKGLMGAGMVDAG